MKQSYDQLKSMLWARPSARVYAVIHGAVVPQLPERLATADVRGWDCLRRGALAPDQAAQAPYVAELTPQGTFTDWLLQEAGTAYPGWGLVAVGSLNLMAMREHGRRLLQVGLPDGQTRKWTWYDPALWAPLLPTLDPMQLDEAFGPLSDWVVVGPQGWQWLTFSAGQLVMSQRECLAAAKAS
jgi:hypothetical protein